MLAHKFKNSLKRSPARIVVLSYLILILAGTLILMLPQATIAGHIDLVDAMFTATSAVCVTGLVVSDTSSTFSMFGQSTIMVLIQIGGIGIMALSTLFMMTLGRRVGLTGKMIMRETYSLEQGKDIFAILKDILFFTLAIELIGALFLFGRFCQNMPTGQAVFNSIFHSVSAFCNAGFCLFQNSFTEYRGDWVVMLTVCFLIILGGIGFFVLSEIRSKFSLCGKSWSFFSLHTKLVLSSTLLLLTFSTLFFIILEWENFPSGMILAEKALSAFFQSVNARTAGFNTLEIQHLTNGTLFMMILLMFIGTAPGSCGGGVKVTTFSSLVILGYSRLRGRRHPQIFCRKISDISISKAVSLIMISLFFIILCIILLQQTEIGEVSHQLSRGKFLELMFETVSAFGTVGLSMDVTHSLTVQGKTIIILMMFIGRLGPLAIAMAVSKRTESQHFSFAEESIMIG